MVANFEKNSVSPGFILNFRTSQLQEFVCSLVKAQNVPLVRFYRCKINSSHPSADCSRHSNVPSLFPAPTILVTKYKGFLGNLFCSGNSRGVLYFELRGMMS